MNFVAYWIPVFTGMVRGAVPLPRKWESSEQTFLIRSLVACRIPACAGMTSQGVGTGMKSKLLPCLLYAVLFLLLSGPAGAAEMDEPAALVEQFHGKLLSVMQRAEELGYRGRYRELKPFINNRFDMPLITDVILGRYRDQLDETQKAEFTSLFSRFSAASYASRFSAYDGEEFVEISREAMKRGRVLIRTELRRRGGDTISLDYLLHEKQGKWYIISVSANGVNDLSLKRAEYAAVIKEKGYNGLITDILFKIDEMEGVTRTPDKSVRDSPGDGK